MKPTLRYAALILVAVFLGFVSPWLSGADDGPILALWFNWLPTLAAQWFEGPEWAELALDVLVLAAQYLVLFAVLGLLRPLGTVAWHFIRAHRHRSGLVR